MVYVTIATPSERVELDRNRFACWSDQYEIIVVVNPLAEDSGTAFRPRPGKPYLYELR